jgi:hypothetical protein
VVAGRAGDGARRPSRRRPRVVSRLLGEAASSAEVVELPGLLREACAALAAEGRPLHAAHADLPWPEGPCRHLWHGATLVREHRGDGHVAALLEAGLTELEALITTARPVAAPRRTPPGRPAAGPGTSGAAGEQALADRGLLDGSGLTAEGRNLRREVEAHTDALSAEPWLHPGAGRMARVVELGAGSSGGCWSRRFRVRGPGQGLIATAVAVQRRSP